MICLTPNAAPVAEANRCHNPSGAKGGQFCGTVGSKADKAESIPAGKEGECFRNAARWTRMHDDFDLVHGKVTNGAGRTFDHAWAESATKVADPTTGVQMAKDRWYHLVQAKPEAKYTGTQATRNLLRTGNFGPWTDAEVGTYRVPLHESNDCHNPSGPQGGQFCGAHSALLAANLRGAETAIKVSPYEIAVIFTEAGTRVTTLTDKAVHHVTLDHALDLTDTVLTHNHPGGSGLSTGDATTAVDRNLREIRAVTASNGVYAARRLGSRWPPNFGTMVVLKDQEVRKEWHEKIAGGHMTIADANARHFDEVYRRAVQQDPAIASQVEYTHVLAH